MSCPLETHIQTCIASQHTDIQIYIHTYIHTFIHTYINSITYISAREMELKSITEERNWSLPEEEKSKKWKVVGGRGTRRVMLRDAQQSSDMH